MEKTKITILCENTAGIEMGIIGEHGFSALIEQGDRKILMDTGQGLGLENNSRFLGIDLGQMETIILSHGHYDHTGGLKYLIPSDRAREVYCHPDIFTPKYVIKPGIGEIFIGTGFTREQLESDMKARFHFLKEFTQVSENIFFSGEIPRQTEFEKNDTRLLVKKGQDFIEDPLLDDASILIETESGPVILTGCAHSGIVNIMNHFAEKTGHKKFHAVIGGTHLGFLGSENQLEKTMDAFDRYELDLIAVSHCTGAKAAAICYNRFKDRFAFANAGWSVNF